MQAFRRAAPRDQHRVGVLAVGWVLLSVLLIGWGRQPRPDIAHWHTENCGPHGIDASREAFYRCQGAIYRLKGQATIQSGYGWGWTTDKEELTLVVATGEGALTLSVRDASGSMRHYDVTPDAPLRAVLPIEPGEAIAPLTFEGDAHRIRYALCYGDLLQACEPF